MSMDDASRKARRLIEATPHLTVATGDASGKPWSCPVYFAHDQAFTPPRSFTASMWTSGSR